MPTTDAELVRLNLPRKPQPWVIRGVSMSQFSVARFYGRAKINVGDGAAEYHYDADADELIRADVWHELVKLRTADARSAKAAAIAKRQRQQPKLPGME